MRFAGALAGVAAVLVAAAAGAQEGIERPDLLTFAHGAIPLAVGGAGAEQGANMTHAVMIVDGRPGGSTIVNRATDETDVEFTYVLPSPTVFDRFAVPDVTETPSPSQTFVRVVEVYGSAAGAEGPWTRLASGELATHASRGEVTELEMEASTPVRWVRVRLQGGIEMLADLMFLEFGELIGNGTQDAPELSEAFHGIWRDRGVRIELRQDGATVTGCVDRAVPLEGTVSGNILRLSGTDPSSGVVSRLILGVADDGAIRGLRSTNGAPFRLYTGAPAPEGTVADCPDLPEPALGCGSVIHGIRFGFDSAEILPGSEAILRQLFEGLEGDAAASVLIEGHTSSEGDEAYNQALSERRAAAVVADLVARGIDASRLDSAGAGESRPVASNDDESGRSLNRRVEVRCQG